MNTSFSHNKFFVGALTVFFLLTFGIFAAAQTDRDSANGKEIYNQLKTFSLTGGAADVSGLVLKRDRVTMIFNGTFYFAAPVENKVSGAVFVGQGAFQTAVPPSDFEKSNVKRLLNADSVQTDFETAVLRFTDDTFDIIGKGKRDGLPTEQARQLASGIEPRILRETGVNISSRLALSIINGENPGFFFANFDGGKLDRFSLVFDAQTRIPTAFFDINAGEKGLIFAYKSLIDFNEVWMAFYSFEDYKNGTVSYSDVNDLVDIADYKMSGGFGNVRSRTV